MFIELFRERNGRQGKKFLFVSFLVTQNSLSNSPLKHNYIHQNSNLNTPQKINTFLKGKESELLDTLKK